MIQAKRSPESARSALAKRRAEAEARAKDHIQILRSSAAMRRHQSVAQVLQRILLRGTEFVLDRASDIFQPQPWAVGKDGKLLGHLLTVDDDVFEVVAEECLVEVLTLPEALEQQWANLEQRAVWVRAYANALRSLADLAEHKDRALREQAGLEASTPKIAESTKSGRNASIPLRQSVQ